MADRRARKTWVWVVVGIIGIVVIAFAVLVGLGMMVVARNVQVTEASQESAERAFDEARERFVGQSPLVTLEDGAHDAVLSRGELDRRLTSYKGPSPERMWLMAWDRKEKRLIKLSVPFWLLRLSPEGRVKIDLPGIGDRRSNITIDELERAGPGLFLDGTVEDAMVLVWTE